MTKRKRDGREIERETRNETGRLGKNQRETIEEAGKNYASRLRQQTQRKKLAITLEQI